MSARVLNPAMMTEMSRNLGVIVASSGSTTASATASVGRVTPSRAALARVRRDLFGPVDHAAARALAERELRAQSILDAERWGFDFRLEVPKTSSSSRFEWELITSRDVVPEPYALRGMPYLRKQSPATPRKLSPRSPRMRKISGEEMSTSPLGTTATLMLETATTTTTTATILTPNGKLLQQQSQQLVTERTPPQETRVPHIGERTPDVVPAIAELSVRSKERSGKAPTLREQPTTPVLSSQTRKQAAITDFMKSRKRTLNGSTKSMIEPPEKVSRNAGKIRS